LPVAGDDQPPQALVVNWALHDVCRRLCGNPDRWRATPSRTGGLRHDDACITLRRALGRRL